MCLREGLECSCFAGLDVLGVGFLGLLNFNFGVNLLNFVRNFLAPVFLNRVF